MLFNEDSELFKVLDYLDKHPVESALQDEWLFILNLRKILLIDNDVEKAKKRLKQWYEKNYHGQLVEQAVKEFNRSLGISEEIYE